MMSKIHIIAEAGSNYNGNEALAFRLNEVAAIAAADSVKYQIINTDALYRKGNYAYGNYDINDVRAIRLRDELTVDQWKAISSNAIDHGISFSASVFDSKGLNLLCALNPPYIKIASCDLNNLTFLREVASRGHKMIVSTGMSTLGDIEKAVITLENEGITGNQLVLMHCVSAYPSQLRDTNLAFIQTLKSAFGSAVGFSDHTIGNEAALIAVSLGATWIEKHFTIDRKLPGLDHKNAMEKDQLIKYVQSIRDAEIALRPFVQKISAAEAFTRQRARRGLYAARDLPAGHHLTEADILILRPESEIPADQADFLVGKELRVDLKIDEPFRLDQFKF